MGGGNASMRIEATALGHVLNKAEFSSGALFVVERRLDGALLPAGVFGDIRSAAEAIDQAVGAGEGSEADYEIAVYHKRPRRRWLWAAAIAVVVLWFVLLFAIAFWPR